METMSPYEETDEKKNRLRRQRSRYCSTPVLEYSKTPNGEIMSRKTEKNQTRQQIFETKELQ
jgi:hypothetical protein